MASGDPMDVFTPLQGLLTFTGLWPMENASVKYTIRGCVVSFIPQIILSVLTCLGLYADRGNLLVFVLSSATTTSLWYYNIKAGKMIFRRKEVVQLMRELRNTASFKFPNLDEQYISTAVNFSRGLIKFVNYFTPCFVIMGLTYPLYQFNPEQPLPLPVGSYLQERPFYIILLYIYEVVAITPAACNYLYTDLMMYVYIILARAYFKVLKEALKEAINGRPANQVSYFGDDTLANDHEINEKLAYCIEFHSAIMQYVSAVERVFSPMLLTQILTNLYLICITGFCIVTVNEINGATTFLSFYLLLIVSQFAITCAAANEIIIESSDVGKACYTANWIECCVEVRKTLFIIMERSKRPVMLTAAKFVPLSLMTLMSVLRSSLSYFTVLKAIFRQSDSE